MCPGGGARSVRDPELIEKSIIRACNGFALADCQTIYLQKHAMNSLVDGARVTNARLAVRTMDP
jgi:hypothetical protein